MRCIVTGGAGFIGSHLVERLLQLGHQVIVLDDFSTGTATLLRSRSNGTIIWQVDICDPPWFYGIDWVFHLAALAQIVPSIERPREYHRVNVTGTVAMLEAARLAGVKRFIYAASSSCYGIPDLYPTPETAPARPLYPYALTKYLGEQYVLHWAQAYKLPALSLRLFNVFGPRQRSNAYGSVFGVFLAQKLAAKPLTIVGDGAQRRDFLWVGDAVEALIAAAQADLSGEVMNVGSGETHSVHELAERISGDGNVVHIPKRPGEPDMTWAHIGKIKRLLGWQPATPFKDGVAEMLRRIEDWRDAPVWTPATISDATKEWFRCLS